MIEKAYSFKKRESKKEINEFDGLKNQALLEPEVSKKEDAERTVSKLPFSNKSRRKSTRK